MAKEKIDQTQQKSFEEQLEAVKLIASKLSSSELTLSDGMTLYKEGMDKLQDAQKMLEEAKLQLQELEVKEL